jgi:hypothetical protein
MHVMHGWIWEGATCSFSASSFFFLYPPDSPFFTLYDVHASSDYSSCPCVRQAIKAILRSGRFVCTYLFFFYYEKKEKEHKSRSPPDSARGQSHIYIKNFLKKKKKSNVIFLRTKRLMTRGYLSTFILSNHLSFFFFPDMVFKIYTSSSQEVPPSWARCISWFYHKLLKTLRRPSFFFIRTALRSLTAWVNATDRRHVIKSFSGTDSVVGLVRHNLSLRVSLLPRRNGTLSSYFYYYYMW